MKISSVILLFSILIISSCSKDNLRIDEKPSDLIGSTIESNMPAATDNNALKTTNLRNGTQKINDKQSNENLERGIGVSIPLFSTDPVLVKTGSWVTLRFGLTDFLTNLNCGEELTQEEIDVIYEDVIQYLEDNDVMVSLDGEAIDILPHFRPESIEKIPYDSEYCQYIISWRYYLNPQSKGDHEFMFSINGEEYTRIISWVPGGGK